MLAIDIGNTSIHTAVIINNDIKRAFKIPTNAVKLFDSHTFYVLFQSYFSINKIELKTNTDIAIASVVPEFDEPICEMFDKYYKCHPYLIKCSKALKLKVKPELANIEELGADRLANAEYCAEYFNDKNTIAIDCGTATTINIILKSGRFIGGIIMPGMRISADALFSKTSKLKYTNLDDCDFNGLKLVGNSTESSVKAGITFGYCCAIDGLLDRILNEFKNTKFQFIGSGGYAERINRLINRFDIIDEFITFKGILKIYKKNR